MPNGDVYAQTNALAAQYSAINLGQGSPDFDGPPKVIQAAADALATGRNQYSLPSGLPELPVAIARHAAAHGLQYDPAHEITVTAGCTEALAAALLSTVGPGDEVLCLEPFYDYYPAMVARAGGVLIPIPLSARHTIDLDAFKSAVTPRTSTILLNTPHNPTGVMLSYAELAALGAIAQRHDLTILSDEVYEELTYGAEHVSPAALPELRDRVIVCSSASKSFSVCGWRIGWALAPRALTEPLREVHRHLISCAPTPFQAAIAAGLEWAHDCDYFDRLRGEYDQRRTILLNALKLTGLDPLLFPDGGFVVLVRTGGRLPDDPLAANELLARTQGVVGLPLPTFFSHPARAAGLLRFSFCKRVEVLEEAARRLGNGGRTLVSTVGRR